jgi:integrase
MPAYKDNKGKWYVKFYADTWDGGKKQVLKRGFTTKKDALAYEHEYKANKQHSPSITLQTLYNAFKEDYKTNYRKSSYIATTGQIRLHIIPYFGQMPINEITPLHIRQWQNKIKSKGLAPTTVRGIEATFKKLLNFAVRYYNLPKSPFVGAISVGKKEVKQKVLTLENWEKLKPHLDMYELTIYQLLLFSGMRVSEMLGLTAADIDFKHNTIDISKQYVYTEKALLPLKTENSRRKISLPVFVMRQIKKYFDSLPVVPDLPFNRWSYNYTGKRLRALCVEAGIEPVSPHTLRHSHATLLISNNIPINVISKRLGHSSIMITLNVYSHCFKESDQQITDFLETVSNQYQKKNKKPRKRRKQGTKGK